MKLDDLKTVENMQNKFDVIFNKNDIESCTFFFFFYRIAYFNKYKHLIIYKSI